MSQWVRNLNIALEMLSGICDRNPSNSRTRISWKKIKKVREKVLSTISCPSRPATKPEMKARLIDCMKKGKKVRECLPGKHSALGRSVTKLAMEESESVSEWGCASKLRTLRLGVSAVIYAAARKRSRRGAPSSTTGNQT